jgi:hypothetical protein
MKLENRNNCNKIYMSGDAVDFMTNTTDFTNVSSISLTTSVNNCQTSDTQLVFTDTVLTLPENTYATTECTSIDSCEATLLYGNVYADLSTEINTNVNLLHTINQTSSTTPFCGITATNRYGSNILSIQLNTNTVSLQSSTQYNSGATDFSAAIKSDIETLLTNNNIIFSTVSVTYQLATGIGVESRYVIQINSTTAITGLIQTSLGDEAFTNITGCDTKVYGFTHKRSTFTVFGYDSSNTALVKWYTDNPWNYSTATGVFIESYNDSTFNVTYNVAGTFTVYMEITTNDSVNQTIIYSWEVDGTNQQVLNSVATKSTSHYTITPNGDTSVVASTEIIGAVANTTGTNNCINYLVLSPYLFGITPESSLTNTSFPDGIYAVNITINYKDGSSESYTDGIFMNCIIKCVVADCVYSTRSYELMTLYNALVALDDCDSYYVDEMTELFNLIVSSLCKPIETISNILNQDCGCS